MNNVTLDGEPLELSYTEIQEKIFIETTAKYVIASCGRRSGKTFGAAQYCVDICLNSTESYKILWCEVSYNQIIAYYQDYFLPILNKLNPGIWHWNAQQRELKIVNSTITFRSSDRPDLLVGRGYRMCVVNEAGIQFFDTPDLWPQYLAPMLLDFSDSRAFFLGTPRGTVDKDGSEARYFHMFKEGQKPDQNKYVSFKYSSYDNPLLDPEQIKELEDEVPYILRAQELYGEFLNRSELQIFQPDWWQTVLTIPSLENVMKKFISIDTAFGVKTINDESAMTVWVKTFDGKFYCIDCWHGRLDFPSLVEQAKTFIDKHQPDNVVIENKASGQSLLQTLKKELPELPITAFEPKGDKVDRATSITSYLQSGHVFLLKGIWNDDLKNQATVFPLGNHDDMVDTVSQALLWAKMSNANMNKMVSRKIIPSKPLTGYSNNYATDKLHGFSTHKDLRMRGYKV